MNLSVANRSYNWKNGPPQRKKKQKKSKGKKLKANANTATTDENPEKNSTDVNTRDYHHRRFCPYPGCRAPIKRVGTHLRNVHKLNEEELDMYKNIKAQRVPVKSSKEVLEETKASDRRERFR